MVETSAGVRPAVPHIRIPDDAPPFLQGARCANCQETFVGLRDTCAKCGVRGRMEPIRLGETGTIHTYSIVHRSFPGVRTPFVSAAVALDGGGNVQATVAHVPTDARTPLFGLPVKLEFAESGQRDRSGAAYVSYHFVPRSALPGDEP